MSYQQPPGSQGYGPPVGYTPQYGAYGPPPGPPPKKGTSPWLIALGILIGAVVLGFGGCMVCVGVGAKSVADKQIAKEKAAEVSKAKPTKVEAKTLLAEYKGNEVRADGLYKDKYVEVTGKVDDIKKDFTDSIYVTLGTGALFEIPEVQCFPSDDFRARAASLKKGQKLTVTGRVDGLMLNVILRDCELK